MAKYANDNVRRELPYTLTNALRHFHNGVAKWYSLDLHVKRLHLRPRHRFTTSLKCSRLTL